MSSKKITKARKILGKSADELSDEQINELHDTATLFADLIIDMYLEMTPEERKKWHEEHGKKQK